MLVLIKENKILFTNGVNDNNPGNIEDVELS